MLTRGGSPLTNANLDDVEKTIGLELPRNYRAFLLRSNGGTANDVAFFGIDLTPKQRLFASSMMRDIPPETLAIATLAIVPVPGLEDDDRPHGALVIAHDGPRVGKIFFWNDAKWTPFVLARHDRGKGKLETIWAKAYKDFFAKLDPIAPSFSKLLAMTGGRFFDAMPAIDESDVASWEAMTKKKLPLEYRKWVLDTNGARVENGKKITLEKGVVGAVTSIAPVGRATPQPNDIRAEHARAKKKIPQGTLPIASGKSGRTYLLDTKKNSVLEWMTKKEPKRIFDDIDAFVAAVEAGTVVQSVKKPARALTERDYRQFVTAELEDLTPLLVADLKKRIFVLDLAQDTKSLDFEVFMKSFDAKLPIVGYQMNGDRQVNTANVDVLPDTSPVIPGRLFERFHGADIGNEEHINAELVRDWFVRGWRKANGKKLFSKPASIMIHDDDQRVVL